MIYVLMQEKHGGPATPFKPNIFNNCPVLSFQRRYFSADKATTATAIPIEVDPLNVLTNVGRRFHYDAREQVRYSKRQCRYVNGKR